MDLKEEQLIRGSVRSHWYYRSKLNALLRLVGDLTEATIIDVGAGSGFFSRELLSRTPARQAICVDPGYPEDRDTLVDGKPLLFRRSIGRTDAQLVLMMDVIEHVEDDRALIAEYADKVLSGTRFVLTVPAFMWLWSSHDVFLEHYRRYTLPQLESALTGCGLTVERGNYFYAAVLPLVAAIRLTKKHASPDAPLQSDMKTYGPVTNALLSGVSNVETWLMRANRIAGTTAFAAAIKR